MKLSDRINFRVNDDERNDFERLFLRWRDVGQAKDGGRYKHARIWSRATYARELFRSALRSLLKLETASAPGGAA